MNTIDVFEDLTAQELVAIEGGKHHWYTPIIDFANGFMDGL